MCGICGIVSLNSQNPIDAELLKAMNTIMSHRGPDGEGYYIDGKIGMGHRRLSIIDLAAGHQPMCNERETIWIVFNGEIYNHLELRENLLQKGHVFKTHSDTEAIIHLYEEFGEKCVEQLRGMFTFAIWDKQSQQLFVARDRIGIKPLYFLKNKDQLLFASEMKALLLSEEIKKKVNTEVINYYLSLRYVPGPETILKDIYKLQPGHILTIKNGSMKIAQYWDLEPTRAGVSADKTDSSAVEEIVRTAVKLRLMSDVPLGAFLSGGLDSSSIVALMSELEANPINTFTIGSKKAGEFNEFLYAEAVATRYKTHHYEENIAYGNLEDLINKIIWHFDEPVSDDASFPLYMISKFAGTRVKVLLSGEGGDEVFGGYNIYGKMMLLNKARGIPLIGKMLPWAEKYISDAKVLNYMKLLRIPLDQGYFGVASVFSEDDKIKLVSVDVKKTFNAGLPERFRSYYDKTKGLSPLQRMQYIDIKTWLPDELLIKADKMSMANSIELRVPLLDHKLVEYAFNLPDKFKANAWNSKIILRNMMKKRLPDKILKRRKVGFDIPLESWLKNDLFEFTRELLLSKRSQERGYFNSNYVRELIDQHVSGRRNNVEKIWSLITLEAWHRKFID